MELNIEGAGSRRKIEREMWATAAPAHRRAHHCRRHRGTAAYLSYLALSYARVLDIRH